MVYLYELISDVNMVCKDTCFFFETYMILESWHFLQNKQLPLGTQKFQLGNSLGHRGAVETMEATSEGAKQCHADDLFFWGEGCWLWLFFAVRSLILVKKELRKTVFLKNPHLELCIDDFCLWDASTQ